jgi:putative SOS response-associated peptidase YedK
MLRRFSRITKTPVPARGWLDNLLWQVQIRSQAKDQGVAAVCYSAQVWQAYQDYVRRFGAEISIREFAELYASREKGAKIKITKAMDDAFLRAGTHETRGIGASIEAWNAQQVTELEQLLFRQRKRLADAERTLQIRSTKKALDDQRIATHKIDWAKGKLADLRRTTPEERDRRIFPGVYAPVMVMEHGKLVIKPMRYQCRPAGKPAFYDTNYPGTYNARRDNLKGFWKGQFGHTHGVIVCDAFYENVSRHNVEGRELAEGEAEGNVVLEFKPRPRQHMLIACLYSYWQGDGEELWSFAAITDDPPAEVAAAGHDRCIIPIREERLDAWLNPDSKNQAEQYAILDDRQRPYYEHRMAA